MADVSMDKSLDEIIRAKRSYRGRGIRARGFRGGFRGGRGRGRAGQVRRGRGFRGGGGSTFSRPQQTPDKWEHDRFETAGRQGGRGRGGASGGIVGQTTKLLISNLDYGVSDADVKELFSEIGALKKAEVHYDRSGRSLGTATVIFDRRTDAVKAVKEYNNVPLDGRPMAVQIVPQGTGVQQVTQGTDNKGTVRQRMGSKPFNGNTNRGGGGGGGTGRGRGRGRGRGGRGGKQRSPAPTAAELDAQLDAYKTSSEVMES
ncbi:hypothetical protein EMCRGX_G027845 [Ephydatia muelleri]|eukprot:Em0020g780a